MGITPEQAAWAKYNLRPGLFIVKLSDGSFLRPFLIQVPLVSRLPAVTEEDIRQSHVHLDHSKLVPVEDIVAQPRKVLLLPPPEHSGSRVSADELSLLRAIAENPNLPSSTFAKLLGISMKRAIEVRKLVVEAGWVTEHRLDSDHLGRGGRRIVLELTKEGRRIWEDAK